MLWYNIVLLVIGIVFVIFGGVVMLRPAKFVNKNSKNVEDDKKKTKRLGLIALCLSIVAIVVGIIL